MDLGHELVKVGATLLLDRRFLKEEVHQHRLAAPDGTENIEAFRDFAAFAREEGKKVGPRRRRIICQPVREHLQLLDRERLGAVGRNLTLRQ